MNTVLGTKPNRNTKSISKIYVINNVLKTPLTKQVKCFKNILVGLDFNEMKNQFYLNKNIPQTNTYPLPASASG